MKIKIENDRIELDNEDGETPCVVMKKPEIDDYSNVTERPLVVNYHQEEETVWTRSCRFAQELQSVCGDSPYFGCYLLFLGEFVSVLMANSQTKNIICYGMDGERKAADAFQNFVSFMRKESSFIILPKRPFVFSALLNSSCHAAVVCLDVCEGLRTVCDAANKIRSGGTLFLYTQKDDVPAELSGLLCRAKMRVFGSCAVYSVAMNADIRAFAEENSSEAAMVPRINVLLDKFGELRMLIPLLKDDSIEGYLYAVELSGQMETLLLALYDALENPELPILANGMKEAVMDCYIGISGGNDMRRYFHRMQQEGKAFTEAMQAEFG